MLSETLVSVKRDAHSTPCAESHAETVRDGAVSQHSAFVHHPCLWKADSALLANGSLALATALARQLIVSECRSYIQHGIILSRCPV